MEPARPLVPNELVLPLRMGGIAATGFSARPGEHGEPFRPIAGQLEEIVVVLEPEPLQVVDQRGERLTVIDRTDGNELAFDAELVVGQPESFVQRGAYETGPF